MKSDTEAEPIKFARRFLELNGAAVENKDAAIEALIPEHLRARLDTAEHIRISGDPEDAQNSRNINGDYVAAYGAPILERMTGMALEKIPLTGCRLEFDYVKSGGFDRLLKDRLTFYGAVASVETVAKVTADYVLVDCRYSARSDEQKEGLLTMVFNANTGGFVPGMAETLDKAGAHTVHTTPKAEAIQTVVSLSDQIELTVGRLLAKRLESFRTRMNRRFQRDIQNLNEYYSSLEQEMKKSLDKTGLSESARSDRLAKIESLPAELASKTDDLFKKYSIKVRLQPTAAKHIHTPAKKLACRLSIGRQTRQFFLTYNPVTRDLEPPGCSRCKKPVSHIHFDDSLKPVCFGCRKQKNS